MVKVGDKVRSLVTEDDVTAGKVYEVTHVYADMDIEVLDCCGDQYWLAIGKYEPITSAPNPLQYFTMNSLVEAVSKAIDAGDTQSARDIIDAMEGKQ